MKCYEIPLTPTPKRFSVNLGGVKVMATLRWHEGVTGCWHMDLTDAETSEPLIRGLALVAGVNLLGQYAHLGIPCALFLHGPDNLDPTRDNLGIDVKLYMATED